MLKRNSGILLHISSLPGTYGVGDLGEEAHRFVDLLKSMGCNRWQILPVGPNGPGNSPYQTYSVFAGDPILISPQKLVAYQLIENELLVKSPVFSSHEVNFKAVSKWKDKVLSQAFKHFKKIENQWLHEYAAFLDEHNWWLDDFAFYGALKKYYNDDVWSDWPVELRNRIPKEMGRMRKILDEEIQYLKFIQFIFFKQWFELKKYANSKGVQIIGDLPLYVAYDSSDVWSNQHLFMLDDRLQMTHVGGVPPDYFSEDGQLWGNPLYKWDVLEESEFHWWIARLYFNFHLFNLVRIDHFRALEAFWAIPANADNAKTGQWLKAKGDRLLAILDERFDVMPIIAEDLGTITGEVEELRDRFNLPGMKVLQFAFASDGENVHLPHNYVKNSVVYTGTHDNDTIIGWWDSCEREEKANAKKYLDKNATVSDRLIKYTWSSVADTAIVPMQDFMNLKSAARMNTPGTKDGNWKWRYRKKDIRKRFIDRMLTFNKIYNRYHG